MHEITVLFHEFPGRFTDFTHTHTHTHTYIYIYIYIYIMCIYYVYNVYICRCLYVTVLGLRGEKDHSDVFLNQRRTCVKNK